MRDTVRTELLERSSVDAVERLERNYSDKFEQPCYLDDHETVRQYQFRRNLEGDSILLETVTVEIFEDETYRASGDRALVAEYFPYADLLD